MIGFPWWLSGKEPACQCRDMGLIPELRRSPGVGTGHPLQSSCLGNPMDRGTWRAAVHVVAKESDTTEQLNTRRLLEDGTHWTLKEWLKVVKVKEVPGGGWQEDIGINLVCTVHKVLGTCQHNYNWFPSTLLIYWHLAYIHDVNNLQKHFCSSISLLLFCNNQPQHFRAEVRCFSFSLNVSLGSWSLAVSGLCSTRLPLNCGFGLVCSRCILEVDLYLHSSHGGVWRLYYTHRSMMPLKA